MNKDFFSKERFKYIIILALFNYIFLGTEYLFDNIVGDIKPQSVVTAQSYILGASVLGFLFFAIIKKYINKKLKYGLLSAFIVVETLLFALMEYSESYHEATLKIGLSDSAFNILYSIVDLGDGCSQSDICKYSCLSKQTVNSSIKKMASLNYLTFKPGKGRVMQIFLTDKGRQLLDEKIYPIIKKENEAFLCMTDEECRLMLELYKKYNNALKNKFKEL